MRKTCFTQVCSQNHQNERGRRLDTKHVSSVTCADPENSVAGVGVMKTFCLEGTLPVFLRKHIATCDLPGGGGVGGVVRTPTPPPSRKASALSR